MIKKILAVFVGIILLLTVFQRWLYWIVGAVAAWFAIRWTADLYYWFKDRGDGW